MANILYPPMIDNTVSAFIIEDEAYQECEIPFYFQNTQADISTDYVIVKVTNAMGVNLLRNDTCKMYQCSRSLTSVTTLANSVRAQYNVRIPATALNLQNNQFGYNNRILVSLMTVAKGVAQSVKTEWDDKNLLSQWVTKNEGLHSVWSESVQRFPIAQPRFALTDLDGLSLDYGALFAAKEYGIQGDLYFNAQGATKETDVLAWYEVELIKQEYDTDSGEYVSESLEHSGRLYPNRMTTGDYNLRYVFKYDFNEFKSTVPVIPVLGFDENGVPIVSEDVLWSDENGRVGLYAEANDTQNVVDIILTYATGKGYIGREQYRFKQIIDETLVKDDNIAFQELFVETRPAQGCVKLQTIINNTSGPINQGTLVFSKRRHGAERWEKFDSQPCPLLTGNTRVLNNDFSAEPGISYDYRVQFYYDTFIETSPETELPEHWEKRYASNEALNTSGTVLITDDCFLCTKNLILKVRYNPEISSYKRNVADSITPTLGGAYPFVRRNGKQIYRTFNLGGLISFNQEVNELNGEDIFHNSMFINVNDIKDIDLNHYATLAPTDRERVYEKLFREKVMNFLYDDQVILFKSLEEGNIFVRLTGVSFTPNKQLGRMIYSFTAQAVEVLEFNGDNYFAHFGSPQEDTLVFRNIYLKAKDGATFNRKTHTLEFIPTDTVIQAAENGKNTLILYQLDNGAYTLQAPQGGQ